MTIARSLLCKEELLSDLPKYCATVTMNSLDKFMENAGNINKLRRILFAVSHLPQEMPNYWQTIKDFSQAELSVSELQTAVQNLEYLNIAAFATDKQLLGDICKDSVGVVLISARQKCGTCEAKLNTRADRPRKLVLYTESSGTLPATHYRKVCSRTRHGCNFVQHYGFHALGIYN